MIITIVISKILIFVYPLSLTLTYFEYQLTLVFFVIIIF